jgi:hypothetical protein
VAMVAELTPPGKGSGLAWPFACRGRIGARCADRSGSERGNSGAQGADPSLPLTRGFGVDRPKYLRTTIGFFPWRFVDGESSIGRCVAMVSEDEFEELAAHRAELPKTRFEDAFDPRHVDRTNELTVSR